jgi:hypothetical protein
VGAMLTLAVKPQWVRCKLDETIEHAGSEANFLSIADHLEYFLVGNNIFLISWSNLYDFFILDALHISLMRCFALYVRKY